MNTGGGNDAAFGPHDSAAGPQYATVGRPNAAAAPNDASVGPHSATAALQNAACLTQSMPPSDAFLPLLGIVCHRLTNRVYFG